MPAVEVFPSVSANADGMLPKRTNVKSTVITANPKNLPNRKPKAAITSFKVALSHFHEMQNMKQTQPVM
jgi:hypothetical protein